jgi:hypothetical protein
VIDDNSGIAYKITTDSGKDKYPQFVPPVIQPADCNCATGVWKKWKTKDENDIMSCTEIKTPILLQVESVENKQGLYKTINEIYFSYTPGFKGGKEGYFSSIKINKQIDIKYPQYTLNTTNDTSLCKNSDSSPATILFIIAIAVLIIGIMAGAIILFNLTTSHNDKIGYFAIACGIVSIILVGVSITMYKYNQ